MVEVSNISDAIKKSWSKETCYPKIRDKWNEWNPYLWQCAVTSLIIQDYFWWELLFCLHNDHYWNKIENWEIVDLTKEQFTWDVKICLDEVVKREFILESEWAMRNETKKRYEILKNKIKKLIY